MVFHDLYDIKNINLSNGDITSVLYWNLLLYPSPTIADIWNTNHDKSNNDDKSSPFLQKKESFTHLFIASVKNL